MNTSEAPLTTTVRGLTDDMFVPGARIRISLDNAALNCDVAYTLITVNEGEVRNETLGWLCLAWRTCPKDLDDPNGLMWMHFTHPHGTMRGSTILDVTGPDGTITVKKKEA